jgi:hypothetical protein
MSDINDLIARNAVRAYNEGLERGEAFERDRIIEIVNDSKVINTDQKYFLLKAIKGEAK